MPFACIFFVANTLCILELLDIIFFGKPYITLFLYIFAGCYYFNLKLYKMYLKKKIKRNI